MRYSFVERARPTLCIRCHALCALGFSCKHKTVRRARRMNVHARRTPDTRRARWTNAVHSLDFITCALYVYALYALCMRPVYAVATRCAFIGFFNMCALYTPCMRPACALHAPCMRSVCALYTLSSLATRCAFVVNSLASPKS